MNQRLAEKIGSGCLNCCALPNATWPWWRINASRGVLFFCRQTVSVTYCSLETSPKPPVSNKMLAAKMLKCLCKSERGNGEKHKNSPTKNNQSANCSSAKQIKTVYSWSSFPRFMDENKREGWLDWQSHNKSSFVRCAAATVCLGLASFGRSTSAMWTVSLHTRCLFHVNQHHSAFVVKVSEWKCCFIRFWRAFCKQGLKWGFFVFF